MAVVVVVVVVVCVCVCVRARGWMARVGHASVCGRGARVLCAVVAAGQGRRRVGRGWVGGWQWR